MDPRHTLSARLDGFKRLSSPLPPRARTLGRMTKLALLYKSKRLLVAIVILGLAGWAAYDTFVRKGRQLIDAFRLSDETPAALDARAMAILVGVAATVALLLIASGTRRIWRAIAVIERGAVTTAIVREVNRRTHRSYKGHYHSWVATCRFKDGSGKKVAVEVSGPAERSLGKGDPVAVVYDPGLPENAIVIRGLPSFVKTSPPLTSDVPPAA
jgi:hypothetical protein